MSVEEKDDILLQVVQVISTHDEVKNANVFVKSIKCDVVKVCSVFQADSRMVGEY